jgi:transposase
VDEALEPQRLVFVDEMGLYTSLAPLYGYAPTGEHLRLSIPLNRGRNTTLLSSMILSGMGPSMAAEGATTPPVFETYDKHILAPHLKQEQVVVMDNLGAHTEDDQGADRGARLRADGAATLLAGLQPDRGSVLQDQGACVQCRSRSREALESVMNFDSGTIAWGHVESKTIPKRRFRRRVGVRRPVSGARPRGHAPTKPRSARGVQRTQMGGSHRLTAAIHAQRPTILGSRLPANAAVASGGGLRGDGPRFARAFAPFEGPAAGSDGHDTRDSHTLRSTPESGSRGGYDGAKRKKGSKVHAAVDTLGHLLALRVSPASEQEREYVGELARAVREATGESVELAYVDQGYTGERAAEEAEAFGMRLEVVKHEEAKRGLVLLPRRWVVERDFAWASRFRRLVKDYERLPATLAGLHFVAFACLFLQQAAGILSAVHNTLDSGLR